MRQHCLDNVYNLTGCRSPSWQQLRSSQACCRRKVKKLKRVYILYYLIHFVTRMEQATSNNWVTIKYNQKNNSKTIYNDNINDNKQSKRSCFTTSFPTKYCGFAAVQTCTVRDVGNMHLPLTASFSDNTLAEVELLGWRLVSVNCPHTVAKISTNSSLKPCLSDLDATCINTTAVQ